VNLYEFVGNDGIDWVDYLGFSCVERIVVQFDDSYELDAPRDKWKDGKLVQKNYYPVSGRQFSGQMNVYDKDGKNIGSYFVISGGHREPHRERGHDTPVPSGQYDVETKKGRRIGYHVLNVSGRGDIEIHDYGTTTGCIAVAGFSEFDKNMEETHKPCCGNKETVKLEVSYNMPADQSEPQGNRFSEGGDPGYKPNHPDENLPYPTAIPVPIASPWSSIRDVINRIFH